MRYAGEYAGAMISLVAEAASHNAIGPEVNKRFEELKSVICKHAEEEFFAIVENPFHSELHVALGSKIQDDLSAEELGEIRNLASELFQDAYRFDEEGNYNVSLFWRSIVSFYGSASYGQGCQLVAALYPTLAIAKAATVLRYMQIKLTCYPGTR